MVKPSGAWTRLRCILGLSCQQSREVAKPNCGALKNYEPNRLGRFAYPRKPSRIGLAAKFLNFLLPFQASSECIFLLKFYCHIHSPLIRRGRQAMRGTPGRKPYIPYQIWNSMSFSKEYVNSRGTAFHLPS